MSKKRKTATLTIRLLESEKLMFEEKRKLYSVKMGKECTLTDVIVFAMLKFDGQLSLY